MIEFRGKFAAFLQSREIGALCPIQRKFTRTTRRAVSSASGGGTDERRTATVVLGLLNSGREVVTARTICM